VPRPIELSIAGQLVPVGDPGWARVAQAWNSVDGLLLAIAVVTSVGDVVSVGEFARAHGLRIDSQGGEWWGIGIYRDEWAAREPSVPTLGGAVR
jgi:hypothetical protein